MKQETMTLTDNQMTHLIHRKIKGDTNHKNSVRDDWLIFSYQTWLKDSRFNQFVKSINDWLAHHKLPIKVIGFTRFDEEDEPDAVEWEVQITLPD